MSVNLHPVPIDKETVPDGDLEQLLRRAGLAVPEWMMPDLLVSFAALRRQLASLHASCPPELPPLYVNSPARPGQL